MKIFSVILVGFFVSGCSVAANYGYTTWPQYAYPGFSEKINRIAGGRAMDCGYYDRIILDRSTMKKNNKAFSDCVEASISNDVPFKFGSVRIPADSYAYEILIYSPDKEYWIIVLDVMLDGSSAIHWVKRCKSISVNSRKFSYAGEGCSKVTTEEWLSDIGI